MPPKRRAPPRRKPTDTVLAALKPLIPAVVTPVVKPVVDRLDRHESILLELKSALAVQFQRIAAIQAHLDILLADSRRR